MRGTGRSQLKKTGRSSSRRKTVKVRGYCRRQGVSRFLQRELTRKDMPF